MKLSRSLAVGLSIIAIFAVSFGILWKQRQTEASRVSNAEISQSATAGSMSAAAGAPQLARGDPGNPTTAAQNAAAPPRGATTPPEENAADSGAVELPVELHFRKRADQGKIQGSVVNNSATELVIDADVFSPSAQETAKFQLTVAPYSGKPFGLDDGLDLHSGDQLTLKSSPYRDKVARIP